MKDKPSAQKKKKRPASKVSVSEQSDLWVHPDINRLLKGSDAKLATGEAANYWMERRRTPKQ
jgi:hypothetical protein